MGTHLYGITGMRAPRSDFTIPSFICTIFVDERRGPERCRWWGWRIYFESLHLRWIRKAIPCGGKRRADLQQGSLLLPTWSFWREQCLGITSVDGLDAAKTQPTARRFFLL